MSLLPFWESVSDMCVCGNIVFTCSFVVCSKDIDRFLSEGARDGVRDDGVTDKVSRGSVDIAL
jgi:hypothetical protein